MHSLLNVQLIDIRELDQYDYSFCDQQINAAGTLTVFIKREVENFAL